MKPPIGLSLEEFRAMLRARQSFCTECEKVIEGIDKWTSPIPDPFAWNVVCEHCGCDHNYGLYAQVLRGMVLQPTPSPERRALEERVLKGMPGSMEGADEAMYVWVDGEYESVEAMTDSRLVALCKRVLLMTVEQRAFVLERIETQFGRKIKPTVEETFDVEPT